jgi:hypothetical protein
MAIIEEKTLEAETKEELHALVALSFSDGWRQFNSFVRVVRQNKQSYSVRLLRMARSVNV